MKLNYNHRTSLRVRYGETDQMGFCYYGNYAQFCEVGRVEALRALGLSYKELEEQGIMLPVTEYSINYHHPARYDDELHITTSISALKGARIYFEYSIENTKGQLIASAKTTLVFIKSVHFKPTQPPQQFIELIKEYVII